MIEPPPMQTVLKGVGPEDLLLVLVLVLVGALGGPLLVWVCRLWL